MNQTLTYILVAILLAVCAYVAFAEGFQDKVFGVIYRLVCNAEKEITGTKKGKERKAQVVKAIHEWLPAWARIFITEADIDELIELAVIKMKKLLSDEAQKKTEKSTAQS